VTMGFRQESHYFTDIHVALKSGDLDKARAILGEWQGHQYQMLTSAEVIKLTIEAALSTAHRHVFGVIFWFIVLPGPTGAVLYRVALFLYQHWGERDSYSKSRSDIYVLDTAIGDETDYLPELRGVDSQFPNGEPAKSHFGEFTRTAFHWIDALPARFTAAAFAIVGDFEDAIYCWRTQASRWPDPLLGIVMAAGAGALGVHLGMPIVRGGLLEDRPELGLGDDPDVAFLDSTIGLIWRALVLWMVFLLVLTIAMLVS
jgi:adenosylcobinamide-phosphate synthase